MLRDQRPRDLPLEIDDLAPVPLQLVLRRADAKLFALTEKPSEAILEGADRERVPARGSGRRG